MLAVAYCIKSIIIPII